jgi:hypothetical protein
MCGVLILNLPGARNLSGPVSLNGIDGNVLGTNGAYVVILNKPINPGAIWTVSLGGNTYQTKGTGLYAVSTTVTPEPVSMTLVATGLTGIGFAGMRKRKKNLS